jgi:predicted RNase H-like nuclease (RuvC/YqgF family)
MKSTVKTVKGRGRPLGSKNKSKTISLTSSLTTIEYLEKEIERKDHTLEIMRDEIRQLEGYLKDQKEKNAFLEVDISHLKDLIRQMAEHL